MCLVGSSITESDRYGLKADPWSKPIIIEKALVSPSMVFGYFFNCVYVTLYSWHVCSLEHAVLLLKVYPILSLFQMDKYHI